MRDVRFGPASEAPSRLQRWVNCSAPAWVSALAFSLAATAVLGVNVVGRLGTNSAAALVTLAIFTGLFVFSLLMVRRRFEKARDRDSIRVAYWPVLGKRDA